MQPIEYKVVAGATPASLDDAIRFFNDIGPACHRRGFLLSLYGSVLRPAWRLTANDVDMLAVPIRPMTLYEANQLVYEICAMGYEEIQRYRGSMNTLAVALKHRGTGIVVDLQIREIGTSPVPPLYQFFQEETMSSQSFRLVEQESLLRQMEQVTRTGQTVLRRLLAEMESLDFRPVASAADYAMNTIMANVDNQRLTDAEFRDFVRTFLSSESASKSSRDYDGDEQHQCHPLP